MRLLSGLLLAMLAVAGDPDAPVRGRVLGALGEPVAGAAIRLESPDGREARAESAADGTFVLDAAPGEASIRVMAPGYGTAWFRGQVRGERPLELRVRRGASLRVSVVDKAGRPVRGATVGLFPAPRVRFLGFPTHLNVDRTETTGPDGVCDLTGLVERFYEVAAVAEGRGVATASVLCGTSDLRLVLRGGRLSDRTYVYAGLPDAHADSAETTAEPPDPTATGRGGAQAPAPEDDPPPAASPDDRPAQREAAPEPPPAATREAALEPEPAAEETDPTRAEVRVRVVSADGLAVPDALVDFCWAEAPAGGFSQGSAGPDIDGFEFTDEAGRARLVLVPGRYAWQATPDDLGTEAASVRDEITVRAGERREVEIRLGDVFSVSVEVVDEHGTPLPSVDVEVQRGAERETLRTGEDGRSRFFAARGVACRLFARPQRRPGASSGPLELPVEAPVVLRIPRSGAISGRILDPDGTPLFGVRVALRREGLEPPDEEGWVAWTDDQGAFSCTGPSEGTYTVEGETFAYRDTLVRGVRVPGTEDVEVRLRRMPRIEGRVVGSKGEPLADVVVHCDEAKAGVVRTAADGSFSLPYPATRDEATLSFRLDGFGIREIKVDPEHAEDLRVALDRE